MHNTIYNNEKSILNTVKQICQNNLTKTDYAIDMTIGNGFDTLFLANLAQKVFGFDIQKQAILNTTKLLDENNLKNYQLFLKSHESVNITLQEYQQKIKLILFNLGYLPKSDKTIMTNQKTTLNALKNCFPLLTKDGLILIVFYPHEEGKKEYQTVINYLKDKKIPCTEYHNTQNANAPFLLSIKKL